MSDIKKLNELLQKAQHCHFGGQPDDAFRALFEAIQEAAHNPIREARKAFAEAFKDDPDFRHTYVANVAMIIYDSQHGKDGKENTGIFYNLNKIEGCNLLANDLIKRLFET